jgi:hypothetical protein
MVCRESYATTCRQYRAKEKGLPWFAPDSPEFTSHRPIATGFSGEEKGGASSTTRTDKWAGKFPTR